MPALSRKQREIAQRHQLFLETGRELLHESGFQLLSMDIVAERAEYSKGTVYQHFSCKEELLIQLCNQCITLLLELGKKASVYPGSHRERFLAFQCAHELWIKKEPDDVHLLQLLNMDGVVNKVKPESLETHRRLEGEILGLCASFFQHAMEDGDLPEGSLNPGELLYGLWSMVYGGQLLRSYELPLESMGVSDPGVAIRTLLQITLDGLQWKPSMTLEETTVLFDYLENEYFKDIIAGQSSSDV